MDEQIVRADKGYRLRFLAVYALVVLLGIALIAWGLPWAKEYLKRSDPERAVGIITVWFVLAFLSIIPMALYVLAVARRVIRYERIPPPGAKAIIDTWPILGQKARLGGRVLVVASLFLIALGLFGALLTPYMVAKVASEKGKIRKPPHSLGGTVLPGSP